MSRDGSLVRVHQAQQVPEQASTDDEVARLWLAGRPESTSRAYLADLARFRAVCGLPLRSLTLGDLQEYASSLEVAGLAAATRARRLAVVCSLLSFAHQIGYTTWDVGGPLRTPRVQDRRHQRHLTEPQVYALLGAAATLRDRAALTLLYGAGLRVSELVALRWVDLVPHGDAGHLHVIGGKGGRDRSIFLSAATWMLLEEYRRAPLQEPGEWVFPGRGGPITARAVEQMVTATAARAGLPRISPHWLRHACASHALDRGAGLHVVRETLGHASLATTSVYVTARPDDSASRYLGV